MYVSNVKINQFNYEQEKSSIVLCSPHSGTFLPEEFLSLTKLSLPEIRQSEDSLVDDLLSFDKKHNNILISAYWSRGVVDLNRSANDFNNNDFSSPIEDFKSNPSRYAYSGLGVIPTRGCHNKKIYEKPIPGEIANEWIKIAWKSFHLKLKSILMETKNKYGYNILLDFHSMPSNFLANKHVDIVLGDCFGKSSSFKIVKFIRDFFKEKNFKVNLNKPFSGGFITEHYGKPLNKSHTIQIEINRSLYIDENTRKKTSNFKHVRNLIKNLLEELENKKTYLLI